jgi:hypothetical protein
MQNRPSISERTKMLKASLVDQTDPAACTEVEDQLTEYLGATLQQRQDDPKWIPVTEHLAYCPSCAEEYRGRQELAEWEAGIDTVDRNRVPSLDLAFLQQAGAETATSRKNRRSIWATFWEETLTGLLIDLGLELQNAFPQPRPAAAGLRTIAPATEGYAVAVTTPKGMAVHLEVEQTATDPQLYALKVQVTLAEVEAEGSYELPEIEVVLLLHDLPTKSQLVDSFGVATFAVAHDELALVKVQVNPLEE